MVAGGGGDGSGGAVSLLATIDDAGAWVPPESVPYELRAPLVTLMEHKRQTMVRNVEVLKKTETRLVEAEEAVPVDDVGHYRQLARIKRHLQLVRRALDAYAVKSTPAAIAETFQEYVNRFLALDAQNKEQLRLEQQRAARDTSRHTPVLPMAGGSGGTVTASATMTATAATTLPGPPGSLPVMASTAAVAAEGADASVTPGLSLGCGTVGMVAPMGGNPGSMRQTEGGVAAAFHSIMNAGGRHVDIAKTLAAEAQYALGDVPRPVDMVAFDVCPEHGKNMRHNQASQILMCDVPGCRWWRRFTDMTSAALAYGEDIEFTKFKYKPVGHMDEILKNSEAAETYVVPPEHLELVSAALFHKGVRNEQISMPLLRQTLSEVKKIVKPLEICKHAYQIYCRLKGVVPLRLSAFLKDKLRLMFIAQEPSYRKHAHGRSNNLSFPFSIYKYLELTGNWKYLPQFSLLRPNNLAVHDHLFRKVCDDLDWEFIPTV